MAHSSVKADDQQGPTLPKDFPLRIHGNGQFYRKRKGRIYYFGKTDDWQSAYSKYLREWPHIEEHGSRPVVQAATPEHESLTIMDLCNSFLGSKLEKTKSGELTSRSFLDYKLTTDRIVAVLGGRTAVDQLRPEDFARLRRELAAGRSPTTLSNEITRSKVVFKFAYDHDLIERPVRYGEAFSKPTKKTMRMHKRKLAKKNGKRMFEAAEVRQLLKEASQPLCAMVLLAMNCAFGQTDLANLREDDIDLDKGFIDYPRPKTGVDRRIPLWPETVKALREWLPLNPTAKVPEAEGLAFITKYGNKWVKVKELSVVENEDGTVSQTGGSPDDAIGKEFAKLLRTTGIKPKGGRKGLNFYAIRHTFETIGGGSLDQVAVNAIMGHAPASSDMSAVYREGVSDDRLRKVVEHVRQWLGFPIPAK